MHLRTLPEDNMGKHVEGFLPTNAAYEVTCVAKVQPADAIVEGYTKYGFATNEEPPRCVYVTYEPEPPERAREVGMWAVGPMSREMLDTHFSDTNEGLGSQGTPTVELGIEHATSLADRDSAALNLARIMLQAEQS